MSLALPHPDGCDPEVDVDAPDDHDDDKGGSDDGRNRDYLDDDDDDDDRRAQPKGQNGFEQNTRRDRERDRWLR